MKSRGASGSWAGLFGFLAAFLVAFGYIRYRAARERRVLEEHDRLTDGLFNGEGQPKMP